MGLDDFMEDDSSNDSSTSSTNNTSSSSTSTSSSDDYDPVADIDESRLTFYGGNGADLRKNPMEREGAMSDLSAAELAKTTDGTITRDEDQIKFHLPVFPIITAERKYNSGERYQLEYENGVTGASWNGRVVTCIGTLQTQLGKINKEVIMFHAGAQDKDEVMERTRERLGDDLDGEAEVYISFFGDAMYMRDLAQANQQYRAGSRLNIDEVASRVLNRNMLHLAVTDDTSAFDQ